MRRKVGGLVWGLVLLAIGFLFLLNNLGYVDYDLWDLIFTFWPLILIVIGVIILLEYVIERRFREEPQPTVSPEKTSQEVGKVEAAKRTLPVGGLILVGLGIAFLIGQLVEADVVSPLILLAIGGAILVKFFVGYYR